MLLKLSQDILDRLDIFILELEELEIPKPMRWEWIWFFSTLLSYFGMTGLRRNKVSNLQLYFSGELHFHLSNLLPFLCPCVLAPTLPIVCNRICKIRSVMCNEIRKISYMHLTDHLSSNNFAPGQILQDVLVTGT